MYYSFSRLIYNATRFKVPSTWSSFLYPPVAVFLLIVPFLLFSFLFFSFFYLPPLNFHFFVLSLEGLLFFYLRITAGFLFRYIYIYIFQKRSNRENFAREGRAELKEKSAEGGNYTKFCSLRVFGRIDLTIRNCLFENFTIFLFFLFYYQV